jgi:ATP-dependent RNA helicase RhlE
MPKQIRGLANDILQDPMTIQIGITSPAKTVSHALYPVAPHLKTALLIKLLGDTRIGSVLVFTRTKHRAKNLGQKLARAGYRSTSLQGNLSQGQRRAALNSFRSGEFQILVATDIAARGIDISNVSHVINYDIPSTAEAYIHRIGRTGRAERSGEAFTLITREDARMVKAINEVIGSRVEQRTLQDFDYHTSLGSTDRKINDPAKANRSRPTKHRRAPRAKAGDRANTGVFWLASKKTASAGRPGKA